MKKLLTILGTVGLVAATGVSVVACSKNANSLEYTFENNKRQLTKKDDTVVIIITDFADLTNVKASSNDTTVLTVTEPNEEGKVTVTAQTNENTAKITLEADNKDSVEISFTIGQKFGINASTDKTDLEVYQNATITITNFLDLVNIQVKATPVGGVDLGLINDQGQISVNAAQVGTVTVTITADNATADKEIVFNIVAPTKVPIQVDALTRDLLVLQSLTITITNVESLVKPTAEIESSGISLAILDDSQISQGKIIVTALNLVGEVHVIIHATNAVAPVIVKITISLLP